MPPETIEIFKEIQKIVAVQARIEEKIDGMDERVTGRLDKLNGSVARHEGQLQSLDKDRSSAFAYISQLKGDLNLIDEKIKSLLSKLDAHIAKEEKKEQKSLIKDNTLYWNILSKIAYALLIFVFIILYNLLVQTKLITKLDGLP